MAEPRNDKPFQQKHIGRPLAFKTPEELQTKIDEYFDWCDNRIRTTVDKEGKEHTYIWAQPYGLAGLAYYLDVDRRTLTNYSQKEPFFPLIARARARIEMDVERNINESRTPQGPMFTAKNNHGWIDESKQTLEANVNTNQLSPEAAAVLAKASRAKEDEK